MIALIYATPFISDDNINWKLVFSENFRDEEHDSNGIMLSPALDCFFNPLHARYVKVVAESIKKCSWWHIGKGAPSWLFIDEISLE